jgi:hypothetical protein
MNNRRANVRRRAYLESLCALSLALIFAVTHLPVPSAAGSGRALAAAAVPGASDTRDKLAPGPAALTLNPDAESRVEETYGKLPLSFEANQGQTDSQVRFLSRGNGYGLFLTATEAVLALGGSGRGESGEELTGSGGRAQKQEAHPPAVLRIKMTGSNPGASVTGLDELPGKSNYYIGNNPDRWRTDVPTFAKVGYRGVYPGIDLIYYGNQGQLEYDYVLSAGAAPSSISLAFEGARHISISREGDLTLDTGGGSVLMRAPVVYQEIDGEKRLVAGRYVQRGKDEIGFEIGEYDREKALVIDPVLTYSTYLGGNGRDRAFDIAVDSAGNAYVTGETLSTNFPRAIFPPYVFYEAFVTKMNPAGSALVYSTYLGGGSEDAGFGVAVDSSGNAYVAGETWSSNFPVKNGFQSASSNSNDAFVTKLSPTGAMLYSSYLGGDSNDIGFDIAVDPSRNIYVAGRTFSSDFPTRNAYQASKKGGYDAFLTKLNPAGSALLYSTYLGSSDDFGDDEECFGLAVDSVGNAYLTGQTSSTSFPTTAKAYRRQLSSTFQEDAFVTKFLTTAVGAASLVYSTYLGGEHEDVGNRIAADSAGNAYVTGTTGSDNFPTKNGFQSLFGGFRDAFFTRLNTRPATCTANATDNCRESLLYSTYMGGTGEDGGRGVAIDTQANVYLTGYTSSKAFPVKNAIQATKPDFSLDAFLTKINPKAVGSASLIHSTFLRGGNEDVGRGVALDPSLNMYVAGYTFSTDFLKKSPFQAVKGSSYDAFVTKVSDRPVLLSLTVAPGVVLGSKTATGTIVISSPAPATGVKVTLADTLPSAAVPASVTIPAGATSKTFTITTALVSTLQSGTVSGTFNGVTRSAPFKVRPIGVASLTLSPNPVVGPNKVTGTVTLELPASPASVTVTLSSSNPSVANPAAASLVFPVGVKTKTFTVNTANVLAPGSATIKATANGVFKSLVLRVN